MHFRKIDAFCTLAKPYQQSKAQPSVGRFRRSIRILKELIGDFTKLCDFVGFRRFYLSKSGEANFDFVRYRDLKNRRLFEIYTIFHTKVLKHGPTPEIGAMRVEHLWVGICPQTKKLGVAAR